MKKRINNKTMMLLVLGLILFLSACGESESSPDSTTAAPSESETETEASSDATPAEPEELMEIKQVTNWFPSPERAGQYAAMYKGFYEEAGLDMTIESGGPGVSATQIVAAGDAQFGMGQGDEILFARDNGIPLVAVAAVFQTNPQALMFHADQGISSFDDLDGRKVYVRAGAAYWDYLVANYDLGHVEEMGYTGSLSEFMGDQTSATQVFATNEPFVMEEQGVDVDYLLLSDGGYPIYGNVIYTTEDFLAENPEIVKAYVEATTKGWLYYKDHYDEINPMIMDVVSDASPDSFEFGATSLQPLVFDDDAAEYGFGYMTEARWQESIDSLVALGLLSDMDVHDVFTSEFFTGWTEIPE